MGLWKTNYCHGDEEDTKKHELARVRKRLDDDIEEMPEDEDDKDKDEVITVKVHVKLATPQDRLFEARLLRNEKSAIPNEMTRCGTVQFATGSFQCHPDNFLDVEIYSFSIGPAVQ